jgi:hypothetical protein
VEEPECPEVHNVDILSLIGKGLFVAFHIKSVEFRHILNKLHPSLVAIVISNRRRGRLDRLYFLHLL